MATAKTNVGLKNKKVQSYKAMMKRGINENVRKEKMKQMSGKGLKVQGAC